MKIIYKKVKTYECKINVTGYIILFLSLAVTKVKTSNLVLLQLDMRTRFRGKKGY